MNERDKSPILRDRSPLVLWKTYDKGLLPTPNIRPLRRVIWVPHPVLELENCINLSKKLRDFSLLNESEPCKYDQGIFLKYQIGIYGEKIARISVDSDEALKLDMDNDYSPRTREIYDMLECQLLHALQDACVNQQGRNGGKAYPRRNSSAEQANPRLSSRGTRGCVSDSRTTNSFLRVRNEVTRRGRGAHTGVPKTQAKDAF